MDIYLDLLDFCYFEVTEAFGGLSDENVWVRPTPSLLSVGELAAHVAYWEAVRFAGEGEDGSALRDLSNCKIKSPLLDPRSGYYTSTLETRPSEAQQALSASQVLAELERIHHEAMGCLRERNPDLDDKAPHWHSSYRELIKYVIFHVSYHTGQMYSVRHLLGDNTPDN